MSIVIKSEPNEPNEPNIVVELSSDDDEVVSTINIGVPNTEFTPRPSTPDDTQCSICLDEITNKCHTDTCWHLFCFQCLKRWTLSSPTCPLCKKPYNLIYHSFNDVLGVRETYNYRIGLPPPPPMPLLLTSTSLRWPPSLWPSGPPPTRLPSSGPPSSEPQPSGPPPTTSSPFSVINYIDPESESRFLRVDMFMDIVRRNERMNNFTGLFDRQGIDYNDNDVSQFYQVMQNFPRPVLERPIIGQATRIRVYVNDAWASPLPDITGRFRDCTSAFYRDNPTQVHRLHGFILRDLVAIRESTRTEGQPMPVPLNSDVSVANLILRSLAIYEIRQLHTLHVLRPFLNGLAVHFCHELYTYANSPYDINGFDRNVEYTYPPHDRELTRPRYYEISPPIHTVGETIVLDSDIEEVQIPSIMEVIVVSSSSDDSDVEILSYSFRSIDALNSASIDQPSTSTGIRDSLDRPNNRYNLRRRRLFSPTVNDSSSFPMQPVCDLTRMSYPPRVRRWRPNLDSSSSDEESITGTQGTLTAHLKREARQSKKNKTKKQKRKHKKRKINTNNSRSEIRSTNRSRSYSESSSSSEDTDIRPSNSCIRTDIIL